MRVSERGRGVGGGGRMVAHRRRKRGHQGEGWPVRLGTGGRKTEVAEKGRKEEAKASERERAGVTGERGRQWSAVVDDTKGEWKGPTKGRDARKKEEKETTSEGMGEGAQPCAGKRPNRPAHDRGTKTSCVVLPQVHGANCS